MSLGQRIKQCRQECHLSQEKLAELVGVTRQAVTKWEADQSAPNTENLFRLAEIFGTTVDLLLTSEEAENRSMIEEVYAIIKQEEQQKANARRADIRRRVLWVLGVMGFYLTVYFLGRIIWCRSETNTVLGFLFYTRPTGEHSYLYGWLLSSGLFWWAMWLCAGAAALKKNYLARSSIIGFSAGLILGILFGPYPDGIPYGHGDYGWAIWGGVFLLSILVGVILERKKRSESPSKASN